jgi:O-glycosyl hydrolase
MLRKITLQWRVIPVLALLFAVLFATTCELEGTAQAGKGRVFDKINAKEPVITGQPAVGLALKMDGSITTQLTVTAESQDDGVLSYQWYTYEDRAEYEADTKADTGTAVTGATAASFSPPIDEEGVFYYYVKVTNTLAETTGEPTAWVKSEPSTVTVNDPANAEYPLITVLSGGGHYIAATPAPTVTLGVTASVTDGGALTYKWFSVTGDAPATTGGTDTGATGATYTLPNTAAATYYYYVVVTNTKAVAGTGRGASEVASPFTVTVVSTNATFTVNTAAAYQYVRGFGGMYTPWDNAPQEYIEDFERMFNPDTGLGLNILRIMIKPDNTDIAKTMSDMVSGKDGDGKDQKIFYDAVKLVNNYGGYVLASPWSPPAAWKTNNSVNGGGTLKTANYKNFAKKLKKFCEVMYNNGAPIYAVSMQNEPTFTAQNYAGCEYDEIEHRNWWQQAGGNTTTGDPFTTGVKGWGGGVEIPRVLTMTGEAHNNVTPFHTATTSALQTENARRFIDLVGRHNYGAGINPIPDNQRWGKEVWMTEHNLNTETNYNVDSTWNYVWKFMNDVDLTLRHNGENAFIWWTAKRFYSFIGDGDYGTTDGNVLPRGYGISHYAKFAKEMTRVAVTPSGTTAGGVSIGNSNFNSTSFNIDSTDVKVTAYKSADGKTISLVMFTPTRYDDANSGSNMGTVQIKLPAGFTVGRATAMRSNSTAQGVTESVIVCNDRNSAIVTLPGSTILSVKFTGAN